MHAPGKSSNNLLTPLFSHLSAHIPTHIDKNTHLAEFLALIRSTPDLQTLYESVQKDSNSIVSSTAAGMAHYNVDASSVSQMDQS